MGGGGLTKGRRGGGMSWFTGTTLRVTQKPAENSLFSHICLIVGQWGTSSLHTRKAGQKGGGGNGIFQIHGPSPALKRCVFNHFRHLFQVTSVFVEHLLCAWPFISPFRSSVSWTQGMMSFWSSIFPICYFRSTWAAVEHLSTVFLSFIYRDELLQPAVNRGRHGACFGL